MPFKDKDNGYKKLVQSVYKLGAVPRIEVGVLSGKADEMHVTEGGTRQVTVLDVAIWNEFGTKKIPERSFIRAWFDENEEKARTAVRRLLSSVVSGKREAKDVANILGTTFVAQIQKRMASGIAPENAEETIERKGSSKPLIDTGQLRSSITFRVVDGKRAT